VLVKEFQSLCLDITVLDKAGNPIDLRGEPDDATENLRTNMSARSRIKRKLQL
jgi:hypothetical protein